MGLRLHGDWIRERWRVRRGFLKVRVAVYLESKQVLSVRVISERVSDGSQLIPLVMVKGNVIRVYANGAYDSRRSFSFLDKHGIELVIRVRRNYSTLSKGC